MNRQINEELTRTAFWYEMTAHLAGFERLVHRRDYLSARDKNTLKRIHKALYESYELAQKQKEYHSCQLEKIRRSYLDEC